MTVVQGRWPTRIYVSIATAAVLTAAAQCVAQAQYLDSVLERVAVLELRDAAYAREAVELRKAIDLMLEERRSRLHEQTDSGSGQSDPGR